LGFQTRPYLPGEERRTIVINAAVIPRDLVLKVGFDEQVIYGYDEVDFTTRAVAAGAHIREHRSLYTRHLHSPRGREQRRRQVHAARLYVTFKRYWWTDRRRGRALWFALIASAHLAGASVKAGGVRGVIETWRILWDAGTRTARWHRRSRAIPALGMREQ
jgi:GT2 family glycosyltransferase